MLSSSAPDANQSSVHETRQELVRRNPPPTQWIFGPEHQLLRIFAPVGLHWLLPETQHLNISHSISPYPVLCSLYTNP